MVITGERFLVKYDPEAAILILAVLDTVDIFADSGVGAPRLQFAPFPAFSGGGVPSPRCASRAEGVAADDEMRPSTIYGGWLRESATLL